MYISPAKCKAKHHRPISQSSNRNGRRVMRCTIFRELVDCCKMSKFTRLQLSCLRTEIYLIFHFQWSNFHDYCFLIVHLPASSPQMILCKVNKKYYLSSFNIYCSEWWMITTWRWLCEITSRLRSIIGNWLKTTVNHWACFWGKEPSFVSGKNELPASPYCRHPRSLLHYPTTSPNQFMTIWTMTVQAVCKIYQ